MGWFGRGGLEVGRLFRATGQMRDDTRILVRARSRAGRAKAATYFAQG